MSPHEFDRLDQKTRMFKDVQGPIFRWCHCAQPSSFTTRNEAGDGTGTTSNQRLSPGGEVLHSRHRFGRQHFEVIVVLTVKGQTLSSSPIRFACVLQRPTHRYSTMAPCALAADAASPRNRYYSAARKACTTFIARSACEQLNSVNDPTMNNSVSKKSSDIPMLPDKARCPHACVWCTQLLLETNAAQGPRHQSEAAWTRCAR